MSAESRENEKSREAAAKSERLLQHTYLSGAVGMTAATAGGGLRAALRRWFGR